jgi:hypothetical protein
LRFSWREVRRGIFIDGYEQPDVVEYLKEFREKMRRLEAEYVKSFLRKGNM